MKVRFFLDVVITERSTVFELLASKDEALLVGRNAHLVSDSGFHGSDPVSDLDIERDGFAGESL